MLDSIGLDDEDTRVLVNTPTNDMHGMLPLIGAARSGEPSLVAWLLQLNADVDARSKRSRRCVPRPRGLRWWHFSQQRLHLLHSSLSRSSR